ncbi:U-scoloptoxin(11)-Sm6a-like [Homarus americanus]|uniref:U-scoloptoxin(11)-Sm6a-like n=1 Tax=Homarus americanus TaxID=6706 RepID=A0A8J5TIV3_HOMAM|nr:U-scoloptoxin(11)-Sm6a-like [Homarus americanus]KAG7175711.1 U-scoloptoxin(11)-Sm6a-like [Homarus americanus]
MGVSVKTFLAVLGLVPMALSSPMVAGNVATNELVDTPIQEEVDLPNCRSGSACGYLQVNAYGVSTKHFCRCPRRLGSCGLHWDPQDGRSVTMGSDQFKFCGSTPSLQVCGRDEAAYTAAYILDKATFSMAGEQHHLHCYCPPPLGHIRSDVVEEVVNEEMILATVYTCSRLPVCTEETPCKEVAIGGGTALVYVKCRCPHESTCPTLGTSITPHSNTYPQGSAYSVHCHRQY